MPVMIALSVIAVVCVIRCFEFEPLERLERMSYDMRVRQSLKFPQPVATNLGFVFIDEDSIRLVRNGSLGLRFGLLWPRQVYGRLVDELSQQGAQGVAFDIVFGELRGDQQAPVKMGDGHLMESDEYFGLTLRRSSNVILALTKEAVPPPLFMTNSAGAGFITTDQDSDGILRRVQLFQSFRKWNPLFARAEEEYGLVLEKAFVTNNNLTIPRIDGDAIKVPLDRDGNFDLTDLVGDQFPPGLARKQTPYTEEIAWHMGIVLAARFLRLDLGHPVFDHAHGQVVLRGPGVERRIPVDANGYAYVNWTIPFGDRRMTTESFHSLLGQYYQRLQGKTEGITNRWRGKLVIVGSSAVIGNNLTDRGATPLSKNTLLASKHWNVANSLITGRFVRRTPLIIDLALIGLLGILAAALAWELPVLLATGLVALAGVLYVAFAIWFYTSRLYWLPIVLPVGGSIFMTYVCTVAWRVIFEQAAKRRVRSIFATVVSPKIVDELLEAESLSLGGVRREITVMFADVRGFTEFTDTSQERVAEFVREHKLSGNDADACFDQQARETLETVNMYLGLVADTIIRQDGTLDKFIGDCVMAFWGAPTANPQHACFCVRAAIDAQRAIHQLNEQRAAENRRREIDNQSRIASGLKAQPLLPLLLLGSGINTGMATVGLMGSEAKTWNYTVFGRDVNLASRLEGLSGRGRIFISKCTLDHLRRDSPELAATCVPQEPQKVKGIASAVEVYEVPWRTETAPLTVSDVQPSGVAST